MSIMAIINIMGNIRGDKMKHRNLENIERHRKSRKSRHSKDNALDEEELQLLLSACDNVIDELYVVASGYCGMREGEIAHMKDTWINFQDKVIVVPSLQPCDCGECMRRSTPGVWKPKSRAGARMIPIRKPALLIFRKYFTIYRSVGKTRQTIYNHIMDVARKTNITKEIYPHSLRATAATLWAGLGMSAGGLMAVMGWENIETAFNYVGADQKSAVRDAHFLEAQVEGRQYT